jgi:hypothetical protein
MHLHAILLSILVAACAGSPPQRASAPIAPPAPAAAKLDAHAAAVAGLVGVWQGNAIGTPMGDFPFAIAFDRDPSGAVHGRLDGAPGMYLEFRFHLDQARWVLDETGAIPNVGTQSDSLAPVPGEAAHWSDGEPAHLAVVLSIANDQLEWTTTIDGKPHSVFKMSRVRGEAEGRIREALARRASQAAANRVQ